MAVDWLGANADNYQPYMVSVHELFARMLALPVITVAALQGHTFAAGAMFSLAHDFQVKRAGRGYWCLPEAPDPMRGGHDRCSAPRGTDRGPGDDRSGRAHDHGDPGQADIQPPAEIRREGYPGGNYT
jgi:hypothetical protein